MRKIIISSLIILTAFTALAQEEDLPEADPNFRKYLDDGLKQDAFGNIQWAMTSVIPGWLDLSYEQKLSRGFSVEGGLGVRTFMGIDLIDRLNDAFYFDRQDMQLKSGFGYSAGLRIHPHMGGITQYSFFGLDYRRRISNLAYDGIEGKFDMKIQSTDIMLSSGNKRILENNISLGFMSSIGVRIYHNSFDTPLYSEGNYLGFVYSLQVKVGYYL